MPHSIVIQQAEKETGFSECVSDETINSFQRVKRPRAFNWVEQKSQEETFPLFGTNGVNSAEGLSFIYVNVWNFCPSDLKSSLVIAFVDIFEDVLYTFNWCAYFYIDVTV